MGSTKPMQPRNCPSQVMVTKAAPATRNAGSSGAAPEL
jgi:hypothetical protein